MSCPYYWWNHNYACRKSKKDVDEDTYYKYCRNYDYDDCPIYKQEPPSDSACYLTTACIKAKKLPDDCYELTTMRNYRDTYLRSLPTGEDDINHYYDVAPKIVRNIESQENSDLIFCSIYNELIIPCIELIEKNDLLGAYNLYKKKTICLEKEYGV